MLLIVAECFPMGINEEPFSCLTEETITGCHIINLQSFLSSVIDFCSQVIVITAHFQSYFGCLFDGSPQFVWLSGSHMINLFVFTPHTLILWGHNQYVPGRPFSLSLPLHLETRCEFKGHISAARGNTDSFQSIKSINHKFFTQKSSSVTSGARTHNFTSSVAVH